MIKLGEDLLSKGKDLVEDFQEGKFDEQVEAVKKMAASLNITPEEAMDKLKIPEAQRAKILELVKKVSK